MQSEVLALTGMTESVLRLFIEARALTKHEREEWDLNAHKPFDKAEVLGLQQTLVARVQPKVDYKGETVSINELNRRMTTNKAMMASLFQQIAQGEVCAVNTDTPTTIGELVFDREQVKRVVGNSHNVTMLTAEELSRVTGWKSESIRNWIKEGVLGGETGELRGQKTYWVSLQAYHAFMQKYVPVGDLAKELNTTAKALSDRLRKLGIPIVGAHETSPGVSRGGLVLRMDDVGSALVQHQGVIQF